MPGGNLSPSQAATSILQGIGAPVNSQNVGAMLGWFQAEGGNWNNNASYNPLNTTLNLPGSRSVNSVGVKAYGNWQQGINATVQTLRNGAYGGIIQAFHNSDPQAVINAIGSSPWGTSGSLVAQTINGALKGQYQAPSAAGGTGAVSTGASSGGFDQAGYQKAMDKYLLGSMQSSADNVWGSDKGAQGFGGGNLLSLAGLTSSSAPNPASYFTAAQSNLQALAGGTVLNASSAVKAQTGTPSNMAGGFLPQGAKYMVGRRDQGRDGTTNPGGPILAPGDGYVVRIGSDPGGFGPRYPIVHFTTGPYAGRTMYIGHTLAAVTQGSFKAGTVLSYTGTTGIGNATVPGWFEIGFADNGTPGPMGQPAPF